MADNVHSEGAASDLAIEELKAEQELLRQKSERKRLESFWWGAVIIWAGIIFVADYLEILPEVGEAGAWSWIFLGAGVLGLVAAIIRAASADLPKATNGDYSWSAVFLVVGASGFVGGGIAFPIVLIVIGIAMIANVILRRN